MYLYTLIQTLTTKEFIVQLYIAVQNIPNYKARQLIIVAQVMCTVKLIVQVLTGEIDSLDLYMNHRRYLPKGSPIVEDAYGS